MTNALIIIILLAVLAVTFAMYSRMGDIRNLLKQHSDSLTSVNYKLTDVRNLVSEASKKSAAAMENTHKTLLDVKEKVDTIKNYAIETANNTSSLYRLEEMADKLGIIKEVFEAIATEDETPTSVTETAEAPHPEPVEEPQPQPDEEPQPQPVTEHEPQPEA